MTNQDYDDDLGEAFPNTHFEESGSARQSVEQWPIVAVGNRPIYHIGRDLLVASLLRDGRQWLFKRLCANPPAWIARRTLRVPEKLQKAACQISVFQFVHALHLHRLANHGHELADGIVERLLRCWPVGYKVRWQGPGRRKKDDVCGRPRQCPFCMARRVVKLYDRLHAAIGLDENDVYLTARLTISDDLFDPNVGFSMYDRCRFVRTCVGNAVVDEMRTLGADGGLITFLVGPRRLQSSNRDGFDYELGVLGRITHATPAFLSVTDATSGLALPTFDEFNNVLLDAKWQLLSGPMALRLSLAGSSVGYRPQGGPANVVGIFKWPSWNLSNHEQFVQHLEATHGLRMFDAWGSFLGMTAAEPRRGRHTARPTPMRRGRFARRDAVAETNAIRASETMDRRRQILSSLQPLLVNNPNIARFGRTRLSAFLTEHGFNPSDRDLRWLAARRTDPAETQEDFDQ